MVAGKEELLPIAHLETGVFGGQVFCTRYCSKQAFKSRHSLAVQVRLEGCPTAETIRIQPDLLEA